MSTVVLGTDKIPCDASYTPYINQGKPIEGIVAITTDAGAYVSGDCVGGIIEIPNMFPTGGGFVAINLLEFIEKGGTNQPSFTVCFFKSNPAGGTYTNNSAPSRVAADTLLKTGPTVKFVAGDYTGLGGDQDGSMAPPAFLVQGTGTSLYMLIQTDAAITFAATSDLLFHYTGKREGS